MVEIHGTDKFPWEYDGEGIAHKYDLPLSCVLPIGQFASQLGADHDEIVQRMEAHGRKLAETRAKKLTPEL
ncbi:MAG: hypothetical protein J7K90_09740 [Desulfuromusa sp.]|nr:hypothetical protein [Desulfuromusa sp.]